MEIQLRIEHDTVQLGFPIGKYTFYLKQEVGIYIGDELFSKGFVAFGRFGAEIYECYGLFVADENGNQVSEAGLDSSWEPIRKPIVELELHYKKQ